MSLPPARWEAAASLPTLRLPRARPASLDLLLSMVWGARNDGIREPFRAQLNHNALKAHWVHTSDGWSLPLWRCPPRGDGCGTPIVLAGDLCLGPRSMDLNDGRSLVRYFHDLGFDVYLFGHRAGPKAIRPNHATTIDFDSIISHDVPAAIQAVRAFSQSRRVHWVGHGFGGQCLVGYLAHDGDDEIGAGALLSSPVRFEPYRATIRRVAAIAERLPQNWRIPTQ